MFRDAPIQDKLMKIYGFSLLIAVVVFASAVLANEIQDTSQRNPKMVDNPEPVTNDNTHLIPKTTFEGPVLEFDFASLHIGVAEYEEGPTGCTVFYFPNSAKSVVDIRGGMPGTIQGIAAADGGVSAICFAGGSLYGLEAATGVSAELFAQSGYSGVYGVRGAIIYDFFRANWIYPDKALGRAALRTAKPGVFPLGARGAGRSATCGKWLLKPFQSESAGQGGAFRQTGPTKVAVFSIVNSLGAIMNREGEIVRGHYNPQTGKRHTLKDVVNLPSSDDNRANPSGGNTTLTLVVTNQKLNMDELHQLAKHVHSSMTRAIYPFHTSVDGDVLYAVTTDEVDNPDINHFVLSHIASELAWDAVLNCFEKEEIRKKVK